MGITEGATQVATSAVESMKSTPLALALLLVNCIFIGFNGYILSAVASNAAERNKTQMELIAQLVGDIRDCRPKTNSLLRLYPPPLSLPISAPR